jgi:hypothetical protein
VVANNKAWDAAEEVRLAFVTELLHRRTTPKGTLRFVTETLLSDPAVATSGDDRDLDKVLGCQQPREGDWWARPAATALLELATPDARLPMLLLVLLVPGVGRLRNLRRGAAGPGRGGCGIAWCCLTVTRLPSTMPRPRAGASLCLGTGPCAPSPSLPRSSLGNPDTCRRCRGRSRRSRRALSPP